MIDCRPPPPSYFPVIIIRRITDVYATLTVTDLGTDMCNVGLNYNFARPLCNYFYAFTHLMCEHICAINIRLTKGFNFPGDEQLDSPDSPMAEGEMQKTDPSILDCEDPGDSDMAPTPGCSRSRDMPGTAPTRKTPAADRTYGIPDPKGERS
jgi:hypothetical protein